MVRRFAVEGPLLAYRGLVIEGLVIEGLVIEGLVIEGLVIEGLVIEDSDCESRLQSLGSRFG